MKKTYEAPSFEILAEEALENFIEKQVQFINIVLNARNPNITPRARHLAFHAKKKRVRKKNMNRLFKKRR